MIAMVTETWNDSRS